MSSMGLVADLSFNQPEVDKIRLPIIMGKNETVQMRGMVLSTIRKRNTANPLVQQLLCSY